jgi:hypothetical protein
MRRERDRSRTRKVTDSKTLVSAVLDLRGVTRLVRERSIMTDWATIVGARVAARAWPTALRDGVLWVRVANSAWLQELTFLRDSMIAAIVGRTGQPPLVRELRLHLPGRDEPLGGPGELGAARSLGHRPPLPPPRVWPSLAADTAARIDRETAAIEDEELRQAMRALRRRLGQ